MPFHFLFLIALNNVFGNYSFYLSDLIFFIIKRLHQPGNILSHSFDNFLLKHFNMKSECFAIILNGNGSRDRRMKNKSTNKRLESDLRKMTENTL